MVDTVAVQDYIFRTNDLKQIVGASYLVEMATHDWLVAALPINNNVVDIHDSAKPFNDKTIEKNGLDAQVYLCGGGNATVAFASSQLAYDFAYRLTNKILQEAPGLQIAIAHVAFDWDSQALGGTDGALARVASEIDKMKMNLPRTIGQTGLGVTLQCDFTHLPVVSIKDGHPVSAEVDRKLSAAANANQRLLSLLNRIPDEKWQSAALMKDFPLQFDELGSTEGEKSVLAIVHTDGNGMSKRFRDISNAFATKFGNQQMLDGQLALSLSIQRQSEQALVSTMKFLLDNITIDKKGKRWLFDRISLDTNRLPLRPIVFGGDDVTFIADGRIGLRLCEEYLRVISDAPLSDGKKLYSRAGVGIVKVHYPFSRAYRLADQLAASCKAFIGELTKEAEEKRIHIDGVNALDWQIAISGQVRDLDEIRETEYSINQGDLIMRPVYIGETIKDLKKTNWRSWNTLLEIMQGFESWQDSHNKIKELRTLLVKDVNSVRNFLVLNDLELPRVTVLSSAQQNGWYMNRCVYYDAVELMDLLV